MKESGYTLIELVVALAISATLLALILPRYDAYEQHIKLRSEAQKLAACMQAANSAVTAPASSVGTNPAVDSVNVNLSQSFDVIPCKLQLQDASGTSIPPSVSGVSALGYICSFTYDGFTLSGSSLVYTVKQLSHGQIDSINNGGLPISSNGLGKIFTVSISADQPSPGSNCPDPVVISVPVLGSPIVISS